MERTCSIRVVDFGSLKALASVTIDGMEIRGFKVIDQEDGKPWVAPPSREVIRDGQKEYFNIVRFDDDERKREFNAWLIGEYEKTKTQVRG
jgi:DNA-binding cell septation regulator SpoVG